MRPYILLFHIIHKDDGPFAFKCISIRAGTAEEVKEKAETAAKEFDKDLYKGSEIILHQIVPC
jgi:hypothetical protein